MFVRATYTEILHEDAATYRGDAAIIDYDAIVGRVSTKIGRPHVTFRQLASAGP